MNSDRVSENQRQGPQKGILELAKEYLVAQFKLGYSSSYSGYSLSQLRNLDPRDFEEAVSEVWENRGYATKVTSDGPDQGVDVIAKSGEQRVAIQAKRYKNGNKVGASTVRNIVGAAQQINANHAAIATTSSFTEPAEDTAEQLDVELVEGKELLRILHQSE